MRSPHRNLLSNGLVQSYGDHTRLALTGITQILKAQYGWFEDRSTVASGAIRSFVDVARDFMINSSIGPSVYSSLILSLAFHDFGKFVGTEFGLDAEDADILAAPMLDVLCKREMRPLVTFLICNHDWIQHLPSGRVPVKFLQSQMEMLAKRWQGAVLPLIGIIQFVGAASLGEGRISKERMEICVPCVQGRLPNHPEDRLAAVFGPSIAKTIASFLHGNNRKEVLSEVILHHVGVEKHLERRTATALRLGLEVSRRYSRDDGKLEHLVFLPPALARHYLGPEVKSKVFTTVSGVKGLYLRV